MYILSDVNELSTLEFEKCEIHSVEFEDASSLQGYHNLSRKTKGFEKFWMADKQYDVSKKILCLGFDATVIGNVPIDRKLIMNRCFFQKRYRKVRDFCETYQAEIPTRLSH